MKNIILTIATFCALNNAAKAASMEPLTDTTKALKIAEKPAAKHWYESLQMRGYTQVRYNRLGETNPNLKCEQCDRYWGNNQGVGIRRARLIISGQVHPRVYLYFQTDAANTVGTGMQFLQVRDLYFDYGLDKKNEFRLRFGQSKVPFGFENLQSSQNRLPLDRADATNSAVANERDMGLFFMWAPSKTRKLYADLIKENLKENKNSYPAPRQIFFDTFPFTPSEKKLDHDPLMPVIGLHMTPSAMTSNPLSRDFIDQLIHKLLSYQAKIVLFGTQAELSHFEFQKDDRISFASHESIIENLAQVQYCDVMIGADSVFKTMSSMAKIPTIIFYEDVKSHFRDRVFIDPYVRKDIMFAYKYAYQSLEGVNIKPAIDFIITILKDRLKLI